MNVSSLVRYRIGSGIRWRSLTICVLFASSASCAWFPESSFTMAPDSRLPRWITLTGVTRSEVTVHVDFFVPFIGDEFARVTVIGRNGKERERFDALETSPVGVQTAAGAPARGEYPNYQVVVVGGATDIFEQRTATNVLYMCNDLAVWAALAPSARPPESIPSKGDSSAR